MGVSRSARFIESCPPPTHMRRPAYLAMLAASVLTVACDPPPPPLTTAEFDSGVLEEVDLAQPTSIDIGPDGRLYVSEVLGRLLAVTLSEDGRAAESVEVIVEADTFEQALGIAVHSSGDIYVSDNYINGTGSGPFSNNIVRLVAPEYTEREVVVSGLPVSGHNHGTNDLEFGPEDRLFIAQGGMTSSGAPSEEDDPRWLGWDETPLSGAILVADVRASAFDGDLVYDSAEATSRTNLVSGDVQVFSSGHRNTYDIEFHSNGLLYSVDNGSSEPVPESIDCDTLGPPPENDPDQLNVVDEGAYYGHANRNRGRFDEQQCENVSPFDEDTEDSMIQLVPPSTNSVLEIREGVFPESWEGDLLIGWWSGGELRRMILAEDGRSIVAQEIVMQDLSAPISMVQDPRTGIIYVAEFAGGTIRYLAPSS